MSYCFKLNTNKNTRYWVIAAKFGSVKAVGTLYYSSI